MTGAGAGGRESLRTSRSLAQPLRNTSTRNATRNGMMATSTAAVIASFTSFADLPAGSRCMRLFLGRWIRRPVDQRANRHRDAEVRAWELLVDDLHGATVCVHELE